MCLCVCVGGGGVGGGGGGGGVKALPYPGSNQQPPDSSFVLIYI